MNSRAQVGAGRQDREPFHRWRWVEAQRGPSEVPKVAEHEAIFLAFDKFVQGVGKFDEDSTTDVMSSACDGDDGDCLMSILAAGYQPPAERSQSVTLSARPEPIMLKPSETAVVVVDMQNAYSTAGGYVDLAGFDISGAQGTIANIKRTIDAARNAGVQVIYFQNGWDKDYVEAGGPGSPNYHKSNALKTMRQRPELLGQLLAKGGWDYAIVDELQPQPGDIVVPKTRYSGFFNTNMDSVLRARGIRNLIFVGIATNVCVESSLRDAFHLEYFGVMLEDATHHLGPDFIQQAVVYNVEKFFGWVSTVDDFCGAISQAAPIEP